MTAIIPKISIKNLHKSFGNKKVLDGINLDIMAGDSVVIIGGSGSGKSVLLKCVLGLVTPDSGSIMIDGQEMIGASLLIRQKILTKIGMLFQGSALFDSLKVWENVAFTLLHRDKKSNNDAKEQAIRNLEMVGLGVQIADLSPAELSGGMQKRVALARAIASKPDIIFFDEPTTGLDPIMSDVINNLIIKVVQKIGATALSITHDLISARKIADRIVMLYQGKLIWSGKTQEIDQSGNMYVDQFIHGRAEGPIQMPIRILS